jgi:hypothetical protein
MAKECGVSGKGVQAGRGFSWVAIAREPIHAMGVQHEQHDIRARMHATTPFEQLRKTRDARLSVERHVE